ncbi:B3/B4 domain-containing protein [Actinokineospora sp. HUAS TT18]|uniref:B3/B4 domain-containing protein n=1 Tax=Actinokineospora sp. HUAS TT18 TaxID=3447451 RepID=UPI003F526B9D
MFFQHSPGMWQQFPELVAGTLSVHGVDKDADVTGRVGRFYDIAGERLAGSSESELPEIQAWRRTFSKMGLKPTQYRCASESLLRRFKKERSLPSIHPVIDLCNAISLAYAIPIAVFDTAEIDASLEVRHAAGDETYLAFNGDEEHPEPNEVVFVDAANKAHARRWTNRQSAYSAVRPTTSSLLVVAEALHESAVDDVQELLATVTEEMDAVWSATAKSTLLSVDSPRFEF